MGSVATYQDIYVHYLTLFPTKDSLGEGTPPAAWQAELDAVSPAAFDPALATSMDMEGGNVGGQRNFDQVYKVRALHAVRAKRDEDYENPYLEAAPDPLPGKRCGYLVEMGPCIVDGE